VNNVCILLIGLLLAAVFLTAGMPGCGQPDSITLEDELDGSQWKLVTINESPLVQDSYISLYFRENGTIWGFAGCNYFGGDYTASDNGTLRFNELSITLLGCLDEGINEQEKAYLDAITAVVSCSLEGNHLEMYGDTGRKVLSFEQMTEYAMDPADLVGTRWTLASVNGELVTTKVPISIYFESDSSATGEAGDFKQEFSYRASGDNIEWYGSQAIWSRETPSEEEIELARYTGMIAQGTSYVLSPDKLELFTYKGDTLVYESLTHTAPPSTAECSALAVYLDHPYPGEEGVDYTRTPVIVTGFVSSPEAKVTVNGIEAEVSGDGTYSSTIRLKEGSNSLQAVATLGNQFDEITYIVGVNADGKMYAVPGLGSGGPRYDSRVLYEHSIELKAGETKLIPLTLEVKKDIMKSELFTYTISRTSGEYSEDRLSMPEGLEVVIEPSELTVCPNTTYISILTIRTSSGVATGEYHFLLEQYLENGFQGRGWISISVTP
jgi:heat shock protein HslJ